MSEGFEKVKISRSNLIGSFADLRYQLVSMTKHCENTTPVVLINLNKLDLANIWLNGLPIEEQARVS